MGDRPTLGLIGLGIWVNPWVATCCGLVMSSSCETSTGKPLLSSSLKVRWPPRRAETSRPGCDVLITMLPDSPDVEAVYMGP
jgi:3-hydroxyisobutyrate dehydrogenase-like beta-hydroxyacid dehydrogenase